MNKSDAAVPAPVSQYTTPAFWERMWRSAGIQSIGLFLVAVIAYGYQPLVSALFFGLAVLNLLWFAAAIRTTLADAGQDGWGAAATVAGASLGGLFYLLLATGVALSHPVAGLEDGAAAKGLNGAMSAIWVVTSFPRAMLIMAGSFGLWRARLISNAMFGVGVAAVVLVLLGGTTWMSGGFWAPDGGYSFYVSPVICMVWVVAVSKLLLSLSPATRPYW